MQQTQYIDPMLGRVGPAGPTSTEHWINLSCMLGSYMRPGADDLESCLAHTQRTPTSAGVAPRACLKQ